MNVQTSPPMIRPLQGIGWMVLAGLCVVATSGLIRSVGTDLPAVQAAFLRFGWGCLFVVPILWRFRPQMVARPVLRLFALRGVAHSLAVACWFFAVARLPVAESTSIAFLNPVLVMLGAALVLRERVTPPRLLALGMTALGALIILRPGLRDLGAPHLAMLGAALFYAISMLIAKQMLRSLSVGVVVASLVVSVTLCLAPFAIWVWRPVGLALFLQLGGVAVLATLSQVLLGRAFRVAPMAATQPVAFLQILWASALGVLAFGEPLDWPLLLGAAMMVAAITAIALSEARDAAKAQPKAGGTGASALD